jgi:hypothetical protein
MLFTNVVSRKRNYLALASKYNTKKQHGEMRPERATKAMKRQHFKTPEINCDQLSTYKLRSLITNGWEEQNERNNGNYIHTWV